MLDISKLANLDEETRAALENMVQEQESLKARNAELEAKASKRSTKAKAPLPEFPSVEVEKDGEITQREVECVLISQGGPWYTVAHIAETVKDGSRTLYLRKYQKVADKDDDGNKTGSFSLKNRSSFRVNSPEHWAAFCAVGARCFPSE